jgi:polysaccharide pyruvyl transferase WcaK-like protein
MASALVYGSFYGRGNVGDELMAAALRGMFEPRGVDLKFVDSLRGTEVATADAVIIGGGSFLFAKPDMDEFARKLLLEHHRPVFYLGVGLETDIHEDHRKLIGIARALITRSAADNIPDADWARRAHSLPDLSYSLPQVSALRDEMSEQSLLVIPNVEVIPTHVDPHWMHVGWERFKDEFAQFLDDLIDRANVNPTFLLMCKNSRQDDRWAAHELIARMRHRSTEFNIVQGHNDCLGMTSFISGFKVVMTQRYHGIVLAQMSAVPHVSLDHHDKLKTVWPRKGVSLPYHGATKTQFLEAYKLAKAMPREQVQISKSLYDDVAVATVTIIEQERNMRVKQVRSSP